MLRKKNQTKILEIIDTLIEVSHEFPSLTNTPDELLALSEDCQNAAIEIGNALEQAVKPTVRGWDEDREITDSAVISDLEKYCDLLFAMNNDYADSIIAEISDTLNTARTKVASFTAKHQIAFLPYKSAMWDSLESIYFAARDDEDCECVVMPLPYCTFDAGRTNPQYHWDGDSFPEDIPITRYEDYNLEEQHPDVIYIHNPFDDANYVIMVDPKYFSDKLKNYTDQLVFVPYYVSPGGFSQDQKNNPVGNNMTWMIAQNEFFKDNARDMPYYDRIIPMGNPKIDKVVRLCREGGDIPDEWKELLNCHKSVMLNTSVIQTLADTGAYFEKLRYIFKIVMDRKELYKNDPSRDVVIIWRPHPLLESTLKSMRADMYDEFQELKKYFLEHHIGIYDTTPAIEHTVACVDAYIGEAATSCTSFFSAVGKPLFILNNYICEEVPAGRKYTMGLYNFITRPDDSRLICTNFGIFKANSDFSNVQIGALYDQHVNYPDYNGICKTATSDEDGIYYLNPCHSAYAAIYDANTDTIRKITSYPFQNDTGLYSHGIISRGDCIYYLCFWSGVLKYDRVTDKWQHWGNIFPSWKHTYSGYTIDDDYLYFVYEGSPKILRVRLSDGDVVTLDVSDDIKGISAITKIGSDIWLCEAYTGDVYHANLEAGSLHIVKAPAEIAPWTTRNFRHFALATPINYGDFFIIMPVFSKYMLKLDKETQTLSLFMPELFADYPDKITTGFDPNMSSRGGNYFRIDDDHLLFKRPYDAKVFLINVRTQEYQVLTINYPADVYDAIYARGNGFEKPDKHSAYVRHENWHYTLNGFFDDLTSGNLDGIKEEQIRQQQTLAMNLDGTCGEKVHALIKGKITDFWT